MFICKTMIITLTSTIVGAILLVALYLNKKREVVRGKGFLTIGNERTDQQLLNVYEDISSYASVLRPHALKVFVGRMVVKAEQFAMGIFEKLSRRFSVVGDMVTGKDIPKNRGSVSFFLKNIEDSKKHSK